MKTHSVVPMWFLLVSLVASLCCLGLSSCEPQAPDKAVEVYGVPRQQTEGARFVVERHGMFRAGFDNNNREILIITDTETKKKYLGITGVGVTEMRTESDGNNGTVTRER